MSEKVALLMRKADSVATLHEFRIALSRRLKYARKRGDRHDDNEQAEGTKRASARTHRGPIVFLKPSDQMNRNTA